MTIDSDRSVILLADDDPTIRQRARETLMEAGFRVLDAVDGEEALKLFAADPPCLAILDVDMPILDGLSVCRALREDFGSDVPVLITPDQDDLEAVQRGFDSGATDFVSKPIHWAALPHRVRYVLKAFQLRADLVRIQQRARVLLAAIPDEVVLFDAAGCVIDVDGSVDTELGATSAAGRRTIEDLFPEAVVRTIREQLKAALSARAPTCVEYEEPETGSRWEARLRPLPDATVLAILRDVTAKRKEQEPLRQLA